MQPSREEQVVMKLKPVLGPVQLVFYGVGVIVGADVYSVIGSAAGIAHQNLWLSFVIGAVVALLTGFSYAEMTTSFPSAGVEYQYLRRAYPNLPSFRLVQVLSSWWAGLLPQPQSPWLLADTSGPSRTFRFGYRRPLFLLYVPH